MNTLLRVLACIGLDALCRACAIEFYEWAIREIDPLDPDVPRIVLHLRELRG